MGHLGYCESLDRDVGLYPDLHVGEQSDLGGMNWWQAIVTVALGNLIVLVPMILNGHAGTKYGITLPVFARASFGIRGTHVASLLRGSSVVGGLESKHGLGESRFTNAPRHSGQVWVKLQCSHLSAMNRYRSISFSSSVFLFFG